jgi:SAM-dependent methyltransferase
MAGQALHSSSAIDWVCDGLPVLDAVVRRGEWFDMVLLAAVWMHLDRSERAAAMPVVAGLLGPGGLVFMSLRHGPIPMGRRMFAVSAKETIELAEACGLRHVLNERVPSSQLENNAAGVEWSRLVFRAAGRERHAA